MSEGTGNLEAVQSILADWARGRMGAGVELFDPEIVFESFMPDSSERIVTRTPQGVEEFMRDFLTQWRDFKIVGDRFSEVNQDRVLVEAHQSGAGRQSGVAVESPIFCVWTFRGGRVVHLVFEYDREGALEAASRFG